MASAKKSERAQPESGRLLSFVERIEQLLSEKAEVAELIKEVKAEAKGANIDVKAMMAIVKLRTMDEDDRAYFQAVLDGYKAELGMLEGTPLGQSALRRFEEARQQRDGAAGNAKTDSDNGANDTNGGAAAAKSASGVAYSAFSGTAADAAAADAAKAEAKRAEAESANQAREAGRAAGKSGKGVLENLYPANDAKRAAWEEGWCQTSGLTGMEVPGAWQRPKRSKGDDAAAEAAVATANNDAAQGGEESSTESAASSPARGRATGAGHTEAGHTAGAGAPA
jgi:uncharacterized protein (UPF0335 family)